MKGYQGLTSTPNHSQSEIRTDHDHPRWYRLMRNKSKDGNESRSSPSPENQGSGWRDILVNSNFLIWPMILLTITFVVYISMYRIPYKVNSSSLFGSNTTTPNDNAVYVKVDSTRLIFLASWTSSVAPVLTGFAITLAAFPVSERLMRDSSADRAARLPTTDQLYLILGLINGSTWGSLYELFKYRLGRKTKDTRCSVALTSLALVTLATLFLSALVIGCDTWLHIATKTVNLIEIDALRGEEAMYGFTATSSCLKTNNSYVAIQSNEIDCSLSSASEWPTLYDPLTVTLTSANRSSEIAVLQIPETNVSYLSTAPSAIDPLHDFVTSTYGIEASCSAVSPQACNLTSQGNVTYDCSNGAYLAEGSEFNDAGIIIQFFKYVDLSDGEDSMEFQPYGVNNPFYTMSTTAGIMLADSKLHDDPDVLALSTSVFAIFKCQVHVVDLEYAWTNGRPQLLTSTSSNLSITNMFVTAVAQNNFWENDARSAAGLADLRAVDAVDLADRFRVTLSNALLSGGAGSIQHSPSRIAQARREIRVARVPLAPLIALIGANMGFVVLGVILTVLAAKTPRNGRAAQYHLTLAGIVAHLFEANQSSNPAINSHQFSTEFNDTMESPVRVGMNRNSRGGFGLKSIPLQNLNALSPMQEDSESPDARRSRIISLLSLHGLGQEVFLTDDDLVRFTRDSYLRPR